jgi:hypothetical protein
VQARLADARLLTLTGVGGCGKTRLALEVARASLDQYPGGVWLAELAPLADPALVQQSVAAVVGVRDAAGQSTVSAIAARLRGRRVLLVLDNCEHLLDACAQLVDALLRACPDVQVLGTSREALGLTGEVAWRVPSLPVPDPQHLPPLPELQNNPAVQLFVERAASSQPHFVLTERNAHAVAQICQRLDGIPLALELGAARLEALTAEQLAARLDERFRLLTGGSRAALPRQQTLRATMDWSYDRGHDLATLLQPPAGTPDWGGAAWEKLDESPRDLAGWVDAATDAGFSGVVLVGHSLGAVKVTHYLAERQDPRVVGLALVAPPLQPAWDTRAYPAAVAEAERLVSSGHPQALFEGPWGAVSAQTYLSLDQVGFDQFGRTTDEPSLARIDRPIFAMIGAEDIQVCTVGDLDVIRRNAKAAPRLETHVIDGADHFFTGHVPDAADLLAKWVATLS